MNVSPKNKLRYAQLSIFDLSFCQNWPQLLFEAQDQKELYRGLRFCASHLTT